MATASIDVQTDEMEKPAPVAIVDLAKEKVRYTYRINISAQESCIHPRGWCTDSSMVEHSPRKWTFELVLTNSSLIAF